MMFTYISNSAPYKEVLSRVLHVKESYIKRFFLGVPQSGAPFLYLCSVHQQNQRKEYEGFVRFTRFQLVTQCGY